MNKVCLLFVACFIAVATASPRNIVAEELENGDIVCKVKLPGVPLAECPPTNCPPAVKPPANRNCPIPDCSDRNNREFLFPTANPNFFLQCAPAANGGWAAIERPCGCMTYFDYTAQRCLHPREWTSNCNATPNPPPAPIACPVYCPTCDDNTTARPIVTVPTTSFDIIVTPTVPTTQSTTAGPTNPTPTTTTRGPNNCQCICVPCIWWPCQPCPTNCPCNV